MWVKYFICIVVDRLLAFNFYRSQIRCTFNHQNISIKIEFWLESILTLGKIVISVISCQAFTVGFDKFVWTKYRSQQSLQCFKRQLQKEKKNRGYRQFSNWVEAKLAECSLSCLISRYMIGSCQINIDGVDWLLPMIQWKSICISLNQIWIQFLPIEYIVAHFFLFFSLSRSVYSKYGIRDLFFSPHRITFNNNVLKTYCYSSRTNNYRLESCYCCATAQNHPRVHFFTLLHY